MIGRMSCDPPARRLDTHTSAPSDPDTQVSSLGEPHFRRCADPPVSDTRQTTHRVKVLGMRSLLSVSGTRDQRIAAIAQTQRGRVSRRQLLAAGITDSQMHRMLRIGWLHRLHYGVYAVGHLAPIELGRETAALLACNEGAVLSHRSAGQIWRLVAIADHAPVDVTVLGTVQHRQS